MATLIKHSEYTKKLSENAKLEDYDKVNETFVNNVLAYTDFLTKDISLGDFVGVNAIFKGFKIKDNGGWKTLLYEDRYYKSFANFSDAFGKETIEDFIPHNFEVTDTIQQQFNL